jgi:C_GCAxxG_C_C family probable redox protein
VTSGSDQAGPEAAVLQARSLFLRQDNSYGCAETTQMALQHALGLPDPDDGSASMALNGGVAYSGGVCGAITGAALAVGRLAGMRIADHRRAKRCARELVGDLMEAFQAEFAATDCRQLVGYDLSSPDQHAAFIASGIWRDTCMRQIEFAVRHVSPLAGPVVWAARTRTPDGTEP